MLHYYNFLFYKTLQHIWKQSPGTLFGPTLEFDTEEAAITMHPRQTLSEGLFRDIPAIFTVASDEGVSTTISNENDQFKSITVLKIH